MDDRTENGLFFQMSVVMVLLLASELPGTWKKITKHVSCDASRTRTRAQERDVVYFDTLYSTTYRVPGMLVTYTRYVIFWYPMSLGCSSQLCRKVPRRYAGSMITGRVLV